MNSTTLFLPGWGIPTQCYSAYADESTTIFDYGFFGKDKNLDFNKLHLEIDKLLKDDAVLIAHSMGSAIALKAATELDKVKALVLISPFARFTADLNYLGQAPSSVDVMSRMITSRPDTILRGFYRDTFFPEKNNIPLPKSHNALALKDGLNFLAHVDYRFLLGDIQVPVLIIQGSSDQIVNPKLAHFMDKNLVTSEYVEIEKGGHGLPFTHLDQCQKLITDFCEKLVVTT